MWLVCQIGAREHYSIARGLQRASQLAALVTDFWVPPVPMAGFLPGTKRLADRFHPDLASASVHAPNSRMLAFELLGRLGKQQGWQRMMARNALFQHEALKILAAYAESHADLTPLGTSGRAQRSTALCLFSYSYAALELFRFAKQRGWRTVLGQIDPGPGEDAIVRRLRAQHPEWAGPSEASPPESYWEQWREECALADRIIVNSAWSRSLLIEAGIEAAKIEVVALAYEEEGDRGQESGVRGQESGDRSQGTGGRERESAPRRRTTFTPPLRVLWLGQVNVRKGIQDLAAAAKMLGEAPTRIDVVGPHGPLPPGLPNNMMFHGAVPRSAAAAWYAQADVFVLPTHSDGFALTQLEALAHGLPVIATPCCGAVVDDGVNGWIVPAGNSQALAERIRGIAINPQCLEPMRHAAKLTAARFGLDRMVAALVDVEIH